MMRRRSSVCKRRSQGDDDDALESQQKPRSTPRGTFLAGSSGWLNKLLSPRISIEKVQHPIIINTAAVGQGPYDLILQRRDGRVGRECKE